MGVVTEVGGDEFGTILTRYDTTGVYQHTARAPRTEGRVAKGIAQGGVGIAQTVFLAAIAGEYHHIFIAHLSDAGSLEEVEVEGILTFVEGLVLTAFTV